MDTRRNTLLQSSPRPHWVISSGGSVPAFLRLVAVVGLLVGMTASSSYGKTGPDSVPQNVRAAIARGLHWLAQNQNPDGSFRAAPQDKPASTAVAVMAFLARGYMPQLGPYHQVIDRGITWILSIQQPDGYIAPPGGTMYDHGISTVMLTEVYGLCHGNLRLQVGKAIGKAIQLILRAQKRTQGIFAGGWRYQPGATDADISCTGWQLMALRGAADSGANIPAAAIKDGIAFVLRDACPNGGFSYQPHGAPGRARTGTGIVALELLGKRNMPQALSGGDYLLAHPLVPNERFYFYAVYYCSQAANQLGGRYWRVIYPHIRDQLLKIQNPSGFWSPSGIEAQGQKSYATGMAILGLCVPFHYLPLYQR